ncbi:MAG TPA: hypothetical protein VK706_10200 [Candidatus Sulfotelmatobacter sp.]|jgi:hypothetical protein|nr:hypothetical protein [Candidatus Sulfotelmatobacter sp.]
MRYFAVLCILLVPLSAAMAADAKAEDIVAKHLDSIGTAEARASIKSLGVQGSLRFKVMAGGAGETSGSWQRLSEERKSKFVMKFGDSKWWGEQFVFDGDKPSIAAATPSHQWSAIGAFVVSQDSIIREGLLGGELGTAWALQNIDDHRVRLDYIGRKKVDGRELDGIGYVSKGNGDMTVKLYFEPETHHHIMTVYSVARAATIVHNAIANAQQQEVHYTLEERFSDFQTGNGITLPRHYDLRFSQELQDGTTNVYDWDMTADKVLENPKIDPVNFQEK